MFKIAEDSPLKSIPNSISFRDRTTIDAVAFAVEIISLAHERLFNFLATASETRNGMPMPENFGPSIVSDTWTIIDTFYRLRNLLKYKDRPSFLDEGVIDRFLSETPTLKDLRDFIQHIDDGKIHKQIDPQNAKVTKTKDPPRLQQLADAQMPIWGSISWVTHLPDRPILLHTYIAGSVRTQKFPFVDPRGKAITRSVCHITFDSYIEKFEVSKLIIFLQEFVKSLEENLNNVYQGMPAYNTRMYASVRFTLKKPEDNQK